MSIQFHCPSCAQAIEVDDDVAGQSAACPYCGKVVTVPTQSTYQPPVSARPLSAPGAARPEGDQVRPEGGAPANSGTAGWSDPERPPPPPPYHAGGLHVGAPPDTRSRAAAIYGNYALICTLLVLALLIAQVMLLVPVVAPHVSSTSQPSQQELARLMQSSPNAGYMVAAHYGSLLFALFGVGFAVASLRQRGSGNWRGWISIVACGGTAACGILSKALSAAAGLAG
jgi:endogenous inhibitor of DNA gyrase (YacG/DUF329 family)